MKTIEEIKTAKEVFAEVRAYFDGLCTEHFVVPFPASSPVWIIASSHWDRMHAEAVRKAAETNVSNADLNEASSRECKWIVSQCLQAYGRGKRG